jgi:hypothetical protein
MDMPQRSTASKRTIIGRVPNMSLAPRHRTLPRLEVSGGRQGARYPQRLRRRGSEARQVDPALTGGHRRSRRRAALEASGVIQSYHAHLSAEAIGLGVLVFVQVTLATHSPGNSQRLQKLIGGLPEVQEAYSLTGDACEAAWNSDPVFGVIGVEN